MEKKPFELYGKVEACLIAHTFGSLVSTEVEKIEVHRGLGVWGDRHAKPRLADVREREFLKFGLQKGIEIANLRQFSAISAEELAGIAAGMNLGGGIPRGCLGENLILNGIPKFTQLPFGTQLFFEKPGGQKRTAVLLVCGENLPCEDAGRAIQEKVQVAGLALRFPKAAMGRRGVVGMVFASGKIHTGDTVTAMIPHQRIYDPN